VAGLTNALVQLRDRRRVFAGCRDVALERLALRGDGHVELHLALPAYALRLLSTDTHRFASASRPPPYWPTAVELTEKPVGVRPSSPVYVTAVTASPRSSPPADAPGTDSSPSADTLVL
jgi:hypothetical protein